MFVYSEISCDEIRSLPIFRACVSTWRYLLRRAATPTVRRSVTCRSPCRSFVTKRHDSAYGSLRLAGRTTERPLRAAEPVAQRVGIDEVRERLLAVDLDDRQEGAVPRLELGVARDVDELEVEAELVACLRHDLERAGAEAAVGGVVDGDPQRVSHREAAAQQPPSGISRDLGVRASGSSVCA